MKKICVIGHFAFGKELLNGQTIKTKIVTSELERQFGIDEVVKVDTHGGIKVLPKLIFSTLKAFRECKNIIILPAYNGIKLIVPLCHVLNSVYKRKLHYAVIGGWINEWLDNHLLIEKMLKKFSGIYVETKAMKRKLINRGLVNTDVMANFKNVQILSNSELVYSYKAPYKMCTFSRVMKEKGIEDAVDAVLRINNEYGIEFVHLDIYGQIDNQQGEWFNHLKGKFTKSVQYKGLVPFDKSVEVLKEYHALLFPTYYEGEGFAGTLIDAMAAGVPVIASDWRYNSEVVVQNKTGVLIETQNQLQLCDAIKKSFEEDWNTMKHFCIEEAQKYSPEKAIQVLIDRLD